MKSINAKKREINIKEFRHRRAEEKDFSTLIDEDTCVYIDGKLAIVYVAAVEEDMSSFYTALESIRYDKSTRTSGLVTTSRIFGYAPRNVKKCALQSILACWRCTGAS